MVKMGFRHPTMGRLGCCFGEQVEVGPKPINRLTLQIMVKHQVLKKSPKGPPSLWPLVFFLTSYKGVVVNIFKTYAKHVMANVTVPKSSTSSNPASSNPALDSSGEMETSKESESLWRLAFAFLGATGRWTVTLVLLLVSCLDSQVVWTEK